MAVNMYRTAKDVAKKPGWLDEEDFKERIKVCEECALYNEHSRRCKECGCYMLVKARLAGSHCPLDKW